MLLIYSDPDYSQVSYQDYVTEYLAVLISSTNIKEVFESFGDTSWYERYVHNLYSFAANKDLTETELLKDLAKESKSLEAFKKKAKEIINLNRGSWLNAELETLARSIEMAKEWNIIEANKSSHPYWQYRTMRDNRVRDEHRILEGKIFRIGDRYGDAIFPPNGFSCRCVSLTLTENDINNNKLVISDGKEYLEMEDIKGKPIIDPEFRFNPSKQLLPMKDLSLTYKDYL